MSTENTFRRIAVAGATGRVGRHVVDVLRERGHEVVSMSRSTGVDVVTGEGLAEALDGVQVIIDTATWPTPEQDAASAFFVTAAGNLHDAGKVAGVQRLVSVSIIGADRFTGGYGAAKIAHEQAVLAGPLPARVLRAAQFHECVAQLLDWSTQGDVGYLPRMRTQLVAARTVAEALVDLATGDWSATDPDTASIGEVAGPRAENLVDAARLLAARRGQPSRIELVSNEADPDRAVFEGGGLLPGPDAILGGPTFEQWLAEAG
jgi:uncharacterized protein YbjT (DUF2867 family)